MSDQLVAELMQALDGIQKTFGSTASLDDRDGRLLIAKRLAERIGGVDVTSTEPTDRPPNAQFVSASLNPTGGIAAVDAMGNVWYCDDVEKLGAGQRYWMQLPSPTLRETVIVTQHGLFRVTGETAEGLTGEPV